MLPRKQLLPLLLLTPTIFAAANQPTTQPTSQPERVTLYTFTGKTSAITFLSTFKGTATFAESDARFALTITNITSLSGTLPAHPADTLTFLTHSPAFVGADPDSFRPARTPDFLTPSPGTTE